MSLDFTVSKYIQLIESLEKKDYEFQTVHEFFSNTLCKTIILRHDVDLKPENSLKFARIQNNFGIRGTYYFRAKSCSWNESIVREIHSLGHEIGYHYENLSDCKGDYKKAILDFEKNLSKFRSIVPITTICMHGSPMSKFDNRHIWKEYNYKDYEIIGEPYFDIDFKEVFYLTDTGRCWDGTKYSIRDLVETNFDESFTGTDEIINAVNLNRIAEKVMFTFHPQRWNDDFFNWSTEFISQSIKNQIKKIIK
jgi:hypothetical protein